MLPSAGAVGSVALRRPQRDERAGHIVAAARLQLVKSIQKFVFTRCDHNVICAHDIVLIHSDNCYYRA